jgi:hypothetical protein
MSNLTTFVARLADGMLLVASMDSGTEGNGQRNTASHTAQYEEERREELLTLCPDVVAVAV